MKKFFLIGLFLCSCQTVQNTVALFEDPSSRVVTQQTPPLYTRGVASLEREKYAIAKTAFEQFLTEEPTSPYTMIANFNLGRALLGLDMFDEAITKFRFVAAQTASGHAPQLQAFALYQLSFCFEATGDQINALATLLDSYQRKQYFASEVAEAELPARIAGAYAATGNFDQAKIYYDRAEDGIRQLKRKENDENYQTPKWLARTLFYMGDVSMRKISFDDIESVLRILTKAQVYLLEAAELGESSWSLKAASELVRSYDRTYDAIANVDLADTENDGFASARKRQERQWVLTEDLMKVLDEMKFNERTDPENKSTRDIFTSVSEMKKKLQLILEQPKIGQDITEGARALKNRQRSKDKNIK